MQEFRKSVCSIWRCYGQSLVSWTNGLFFTHSVQSVPTLMSTAQAAVVTRSN